MKIWKPLTKFRYSNERDEWKYHTDFSLEEGEPLLFAGGRKTDVKIDERVPKGKVWKVHFEMAVEEFDK